MLVESGFGIMSSFRLEAGTKALPQQIIGVAYMPVATDHNGKILPFMS
jgi:hypothetical protein